MFNIGSSVIKSVIKLGIALSFVTQLVGCSHFQALHPGALLPNTDQSQLAEPPAHLARLIIIRSRESLLPFPEKNPVQLYNGTEKIADIPHGKFLRLDSPKLPQHLTVHWFDQENPTISRTINLQINLQPGEIQTIELNMEQNDLIAQLIDQKTTTSRLPWYAEVSTPEDFSESYVSFSPKTPPTNKNGPL